MDAGEWTPIAKVYSPLMAGSIDMTDTEPHDHGVVRAMNSKYKPNKDVKGDPNSTIFVARLNPKTNEETLESAFSYFGDINNIRLVRDIMTGHSRGYAFIEYKEKRSANRAERDGHKMEVDGHEVLVDYELERNLEGWIPRRMGGGFGGKKESGQLRFGGKDRPWRKPISMQSGYDSQQYDDRDRSDRNDNKSDRHRQSYVRSRRRSRDRSRSRDDHRSRHRSRSRNRSRSRERSRRKRSSSR